MIGTGYDPGLSLPALPGIRVVRVRPGGDTYPEEVSAVSLLAAVDATCAALGADPADAAPMALLRLYAREIDQRAAVRAAADRALLAAEKDGDDALVEQVAALRAKVAERDTLDRIGRRCEALLVELLATPKSRPVKPAAPAGGGALQKLRAVP